MTIPRMEAISKSWQANPPLSVTARLIAASLGVKFKMPARSTSNSDVSDMLEDIGGSVNVAPAPEWLQEMFREEESRPRHG